MQLPLPHEIDKRRTLELCEKQARADFEMYKGHIILVQWLYGYEKNHDGFSAEALCDPLLHARVGTRVETGDLINWNDEFLDPYWDVTPVEKTPATQGLRSAWVHGISYNRNTGQREKHVGWLPRLSPGHEQCLICLAD